MPSCVIRMSSVSTHCFANAGASMDDAEKIDCDADGLQSEPDPYSVAHRTGVARAWETPALGKVMDQG